MESKPQKLEPQKSFVLSEVHTDMHHVIAHPIKIRYLDRGIVTEFVKVKKYYNAVFVGYDAEGNLRHAHKRGTYTTGDTFKGNVDSCDLRYSFHWIGQSDTAYVFESPIDMLSFVSLYQQNWKQHSYVALCGVAEHVLMQLLIDVPHVNKIALCLDNDRAGVQARERIQKHLAERGYRNVFSLFSNLKDWNEDLQALSRPPPELVEKQQQVIQMG